MNNKWHRENIKTIEKLLKTDLSDGLSISEARLRLEREAKADKGKRKSLFVREKRSSLQCLLVYFTSPSVILLTVMSLLTALFGRVELGVSLLVAITLGAIVGGAINLNATRRIEAMGEYSSPMLKVKRGGHIFRTDGRNAVVGDIIILAAGDLLPCDARLISSVELVVEEIYHNGHEISIRRIEKHCDVDYSDSDINSPDAVNMLYAGSVIYSGQAIAVVTNVSGNVYLADYLTAGALSGKEAEAEGITYIKPTIYKVTFISVSALLLLSLLGLLTLQGVDFICVFAMLLSSIVLISADLLKIGSNEILSSFIKKISNAKYKNKDFSASIRGIKTFDALNSVTDLILVGKAGLTDGTQHIDSAYTLAGQIKELTPETSQGRRLLSFMHTYIKALRESGTENYFTQNGYIDSLGDFVKNSGFDMSGASLAIKSLYFANDSENKHGFACAETSKEAYRTSLLFDKRIINKCNYVYDNNELRHIEKKDIIVLEAISRQIEDNGGECLYIISGNDEIIAFEGVLSLKEMAPANLSDTLNALSSMNVKVTVFLPDDSDDTKKFLQNSHYSSLFKDNIAYAKDFKRQNKNVIDNIGAYSAYVGFTIEEYCAIIAKMRKTNHRVATYGISNDYNEIYARADVSVSADVLKYSSEKYKISVFEKLPAEGRDTNIRCSQQTRLLSKVLVKRDTLNDCGLFSIAYAIKKARSAYISVSQSMLLFAYLMCALLSISAMSVVTGVMLLDSLKALALAIVFAFLSIVAFTKAEHKPKFFTQKLDYSRLPAIIFKNNLEKIIARASLGVISAIAIKVLDACGVFGADPTFTMPIFICLLLTIFAEVFVINHKFTIRGEGRRYSWLKVIVAYAILMTVGALSTVQPLVNEFYPDGKIGSLEFLIVPAYALLYIIMLLTLYIIERTRKKA